MLRPGGAACPAPARAFTTELSWTGSPQVPRSAMTGWFIVIYHRRTFTGWTGSLMGCDLTLHKIEHAPSSLSPRFMHQYCFSSAGRGNGSTAIELSELRQDRNADFSPLPAVLS